MSDIIGVLGSLTTAVIGTATPYTVPSGKAAKVKIEYRGVSGINSTLAVAINGLTIFGTAALTTGHVIYTTTLLMVNDAATASVIDGSSDAKVVAPGPKEYYLSEGDTVTYVIATADFSSMNFQVVGTEVDLA